MVRVQALTERLTEILDATVFVGSHRDVRSDEPLGEKGMGLDSLALVQFLTAVEQQFDVEIPVDTWARADQLTLEDCAQLLVQTTGPSETEQRLVAIWQAVLSADSIGPEDNFLELQGGTDRIEEMLAEVRRVFGVIAEGLALSDFERQPTIRGLAAMIDARATERSSSLVIAVQPSGSEIPLFLMHAGGGYVFFYRALAVCLNEARPVYCIRAATPADAGGPAFVDAPSIEALAEQYIAEMKAVRPEGPYLLGGACVGGVIAFEMARQLQARGDEIAGPVLLFDSFVANNEFSKVDTLAVIEEYIALQDPASHGEPTLRKRINRKLREALDLGLVAGAGLLVGSVARRSVSELKRVAGAASGAARDASDHAVSGLDEVATVTDGPMQPAFLAESMNAALRLVLAYRPGRFRGALALFNAVGSGDFERLWAGLASDGLQVYDRPGLHLEMLDHPRVTDTAALVESCFAGQTRAATRSEGASARTV